MKNNLIIAIICGVFGFLLTYNDVPIIATLLNVFSFYIILIILNLYLVTKDK